MSVITERATPKPPDMIQRIIAEQIQHQREHSADYLVVDDQTMLAVVDRRTRCLRDRRRRVVAELEQLAADGILRPYSLDHPLPGTYRINDPLNAEHAAIIESLLPADGSRVWPRDIVDPADAAGVSETTVTRTLCGLVQRGRAHFAPDGFARASVEIVQGDWCHAVNDDYPWAGEPWHCVIPAAEHGDYHRDGTGMWWTTDTLSEQIGT